MRKVGRKRKKKKEREKAHKLDSLDLSSHFSASCLLRLPEKASPRSQGNKIQDRFDLRILCHDQIRDPPS